MHAGNAFTHRGSRTGDHSLRNEGRVRQGETARPWTELHGRAGCAPETCYEIATEPE